MYASKKKSLPPSKPAVSSVAIPRVGLTNAELANELLALAQLLSAQKENPYKIRAYRKAAETIRSLPESISEMVAKKENLTEIAGIGDAIASALKEIVTSGRLRKLDTLRGSVDPAVVALGEYPRLDPARVKRVYAQLGISTVGELKEALQSGAIGKTMSSRIEQHVRSALTESTTLLLYDADEIAPKIQQYLETVCGAARSVVTGETRRRVDVVNELTFLVEGDFASVVAKFQRYAGGATVISAEFPRALFKIGTGAMVLLEFADARKWGIALIGSTGSEAHLDALEQQTNGLAKLAKTKQRFPTEDLVYEALDITYIQPELREGRDEIERAQHGTLPKLINNSDLRGDLHAHSAASDGAHSIEDMIEGARERGYHYLGITDHSQSLKIANGVAERDLWKQIRRIDKLNAKLKFFRVLKSAEVDILADGTLDYSDDLLRELDYTICSIHSRFGFDKQTQTQRIMRAMDHPCFDILGHATGRLLLRRPGYELDMEKLVAHARERGCFFEINSSPDRLDLSAENARLAHEAGIKIAVNTDAHSISELGFIRWGVDQARRAGLEAKDVLNCLSWPQIEKQLRSRR